MPRRNLSRKTKIIKNPKMFNKGYSDNSNDHSSATNLPRSDINDASLCVSDEANASKGHVPPMKYFITKVDIQI